MSSESAMSVFRAIEGRRAIRSYQPVDVDAESIHKLLRAAGQAPTAVHLEPWAFAIIQDRARLKRYSDRAKALVREDATSFRTGTSGAHAEGHIALLDDPTYNIAAGAWRAFLI